MTQTVFVLGAGASVHTGTPLMQDFLLKAEDLHRGMANEDADFVRVLRGWKALSATHSKSRFALRNLETVFAAFEMAQLLKIDGPEPLGTQELVDAMRRVIARTIQETTKVVRRSGRIQASSSYWQLASFIDSLRVHGSHYISILSFNYDVALEIALLIQGMEPDYLLPSAPVANKSRAIDVLKLHGSLNWNTCADGCAGIGVLSVRDIIARWEEQQLPSTQTNDEIRLRLDAPMYANNRCVSGKHPLIGTTVIVPPTMQKLSEHRALGEVWAQAAARLQQADNIVIIRYSWPEGDQFFHQLFALGTMGDTILRKVVAIDPDPKLPEKFQDRLLGQQPEFAHIDKLFDGDSIAALGAALGHNYRQTPQVFRKVNSNLP